MKAFHAAVKQVVRFSLYHKTCIQQEEEYFYQQIGLKFEKETNKMPHLEHGFL